MRANLEWSGSILEGFLDLGCFGMFWDSWPIHVPCFHLPGLVESFIPSPPGHDVSPKMNKFPRCSSSWWVWWPRLTSFPSRYLSICLFIFDPVGWNGKTPSSGRAARRWLTLSLPLIKPFLGQKKNQNKEKKEIMLWISLGQASS